MSRAAERKEELFDAARRLEEPSKRAAFLEFACGGDTELQARIEKLLASYDDAERFFHESVSCFGTVADSGPIEAGASNVQGIPIKETVGTLIGRYRLLEKIGEGGCGVVYLAEQEEPVRRRVALKIIRVGMETRSVIARFEAERQALAMMDHPNIARVFDAGATEHGSPYFVMEHVRGERVTAYCEKNSLSIRGRLDLFIQICHAIQHAHQKGIVHGDIKPSNIMIAMHDGVAVPKVIDFGISKATEPRLSDRIPFSAYAQLIGTPAYMSPEQIEMGGVDVDTRSDIYSLGTLLYELLTGRAPLDSCRLLENGLEEMRRLMREEIPDRPSVRLGKLDRDELISIARMRRSQPKRLIADLVGDIDCITMKALEKDRRRRYETANGLASDVYRHLCAEPVTAHAPGWVYRSNKLFRRNRVMFIAGGAVALALVAGTGVSTWLLLREREARRRAVAAEQQQARLREEAESREKITQAALMVSQGRHAEADSILDRASLKEPTMEGAAVFRAVGEWHAFNNRWSEASERFAVLLGINQFEGTDVSSLDYLERGPALVESGDTGGYERFRREAIIRFSKAQSPFADRIIKISLLLPAGEDFIRSISPLAAVTKGAVVEAELKGDLFTAAWRRMSLAVFEYRRGDYVAAVDEARQCLAYSDSNAPRSATARLVLAMASYRLGQLEQADLHLSAAQEIVENKFRSQMDRGNPVQGFWFDWVYARIFLREANSLIR